MAIWGAGETGKAFADALAAEGIRVALFLEVDPQKSAGPSRARRSWRTSRPRRASGLPLLVAVGAPGARDLIRAELVRAGFAELADFRCVA